MHANILSGGIIVYISVPVFRDLSSVSNALFIRVTKCAMRYDTQHPSKHALMRTVSGNQPSKTHSRVRHLECSTAVFQILSNYYANVNDDVRSINYPAHALYPLNILRIRHNVQRARSARTITKIRHGCRTCSHIIPN